jgi:hypothetical protein
VATAQTPKHSTVAVVSCRVFLVTCITSRLNARLPLTLTMWYKVYIHCMLTKWSNQSATLKVAENLPFVFLALRVWFWGGARKHQKQECTLQCERRLGMTDTPANRHETPHKAQTSMAARSKPKIARLHETSVCGC